ncbi:MAG: ROK family protein [Woeseiaceae bacterium]
MRERHVTLAVDMGGTAWKAAVMRDGRALAFDSMPNRSRVEDLEELSTLFDRLLQDAGSSLQSCAGLGISLAEIVDSDAKACPSPCYKHPYFEGHEVEPILRQFIDLPVQIDNDSRASILGEEAYGVLSNLGSGAENVVMVTLGTGIGVAARVNGTLLRGARHTGGLLSGHITVDMNGPRCICGNIGCPEALASGYALANYAPGRPWFAESSLAGEAGPTFRMLTDAVRQGDKHAKTGLDEMCDAWTALLVSLVHAFGPAHLALSGGFMRSADLFLDGIEQAVRQRLWDPNLMPEIHVAEEPELSGVRGCEVLVRRAIN